MTCKAYKIKTDHYLLEEDEVSDFGIDQTVIGNESFLKYVAQYRKCQVREFASDSSISDWYPYVNSYYPYTEDVDAFARVSHLLGSKPSFASISLASEWNQYTEVQDKVPYTEPAAQYHYLQSNPISFIILGKPDIGERELGQRLADYWHCVYIDPETLIEQEMLSGSRAGQCIEFNLRSGRAIGIDVILRLVEKRTKSESAKHRGFVICGLPLIPNDLYKEDLISSESAVFTAKEIFEQIFDVADKLLPETPTKPPASVASKYEEENDEFEEEEEEFGEEESEERPSKKQVPDRFPDIQIPIDIGPDFDVCQRPNIGTNYEDQLNFIFNLLKAPFMIIYIMCSSADVIEKRRNYRFDVNEKQTISLQTEKYNDHIFTIYAQQENLDEEVLKDFLETRYISIDTSHLDYLVKLPRHFPANVSTQLDAYHYTGLHFIERRVLMHDPQYFLKVDGRVTVKRMFRLVRSRLKILPIQKVILPTRLTFEPTYVGEGAGAQEQLTDLENLYGELTRSQVPSNIFKWHWSDWGMKCPVALKEGSLKDGDSKYAVHFMNKIFFLATEENYFKFYRNPRPYLIPPNPKPVCSIFVMGPRFSGKTAVSQCLSFLLDGTVLSYTDMVAYFISSQEEELKEKARIKAQDEALRLLIETRQEEAKLLEAERVEKIKAWMASTTALIVELIDVMTEKEQDQTVTSFEISSFPMAMKRVSVIEAENPLALKCVRLQEQLRSLRVPVSDKIADMQALLAEKRKLLVYLPPPLRTKVVPKPATVNDPFVEDYVREAIENVTFDEISTTNKNLANIILDRIRQVENEHLEHSNIKGGWVIDGMTCDVVIIEEMYPDFMPSEVIMLLDEDDANFLANKYEYEDYTEFTEYRQFFFNIGQVDAAWRAPPYLPKKSDTEVVVQQILGDLIEDSRHFDYNDDGPVNKVDVYRQEVQSFSQKWLDTKQYFLDHNIVPIEVKVTDKSLTSLMEEIVETVLNKYRIGASLFTELDRAEEVKNYGNQMLQKNLGEGPDFDEVNAFEGNRRYGDTYNYCPVTYFEKGVLWKGKEDFAVKFQDKLYLLSNEEDMNKFLKAPRKFLTGEPPQTFPPPRLCIIGVPGTGRTTVAKALAKNYGLVYVSFESLLKKYFSVTSHHSLDQLRRNLNLNETLSNYLNVDVPLPKELLYNILSKFWFEQPKVGFVLDDFPKRPSDVKTMTNFKLIPDMILNLTNNNGQIKNNIIKDYLKQWETEVNGKRQAADNQNKSVQLEWEEKRKYRFEELIEERRARRYATKMKHKATAEKPATDGPYMEDLREPDEEGQKTGLKSESQVSFDSVAEQEDVDEVNRLLNKELPEPLVDDISETVDQARDKFEALAIDTLNVESRFLTSIKGICSVEEIPLTDVTANFEYPELTVRQAFFISDEFKFRNSSYFERCYDVSMEVAERLLECGYFFLSKFGKTCPVQHYEGKIPVQMYLPMEARNSLFPVIHRSYIYYLTGSENQEKFKQDPLKFIHVEAFNFPLLTFKVAVTGPPKSGKTVLSRRIASEYGFKLITRGEAARYVLTFLPLSDLAKCMEVVLKQGWELTDEMVVKCVEAAAFDSKAVTQGIVFDGFPNTITETRHLSYVGFVPNLDMDLLATHDEVLECLSFDGNHISLPRFSVGFMKHLLDEWNTYSQTFRKWFDREYQVTTQIPISTSNWSVWHQTEKYIRSVFFEIKHYFIHVTDDLPLRLASMQVTPLEFLERQGAFKTYCPCCLHHFNRLACGGDPPDRTGLVQYRYFFYWLCEDHLEKFLKNPDMFLIPFNHHSLPQVLPKIVHPTSIPDNVFEGGLCVACFKNRRMYVKGNLSNAATYNDRVYLFDIQECLKKFMADPTKFTCEITFKPPDDYPPLNYKDLPILGLLEQYLAKLITRSLSFVARKRPVIPGLGIQASALVAMGLYLKMANPNIPEEYRPLYKEGDDLFHERRLKLINYLDKMKSAINPYLYYENPMPDFEVSDTEVSVSTESLTTTATKVVDEMVDNVDCDT